MTVRIKISGPIIDNGDKWFYDWFDEDATCSNDVIKLLPDNGEDVEVIINSNGGLVDVGNEIYTALKLYNGKVTIDVVMAGSAASVIAMAGNPTRISPVGQIMIHNSSMGAWGDYRDMDKASEILQKTNQSISKAYQIKTGRSQEELLDRMNKVSWLTADEAKELGFVDEILFENERPVMVASADTGMISPKIINEMKRLRNRTSEITVEIPENKIKKMVDQAIEELTTKTIIEGKSLKELMVKENTENEKLQNENSFRQFLF